MTSRDNPSSVFDFSAERLFRSANEVFLRATVEQPRRVLEVRGAIEDLFGDTEASRDLPPLAWDERIVESDRPAVSAAMTRAAQGESYELRYRIVRDGEETTLVERGVFVQIGDELQAQALVRDASEGERLRRAVEQQREALEDALADSDETYLELQVANERLREAQRIAGLGCWEWDLVHERLTWTEETFGIWGLSPEDGPPSPEEFYSTMPPSDAARLRDHAAGSIESGERFEFEHRVIRPNGDIRWVHCTGTVVANPHGQPLRMVGTTQDVTDRRHLEEQLRQSQKMEAVGRLAGGVAHDFNNILTAIFSFTEFSLENMHPADSSYQDLQEVLKAAFRAKELTAQLLAFSRRRTVAPRVLNANRVVTNIQRLLQRTLGEDVAYQTILGANLWPTRVDPDALEQVIVNLAVNAREAMPDGGSLTVETRNVELDAMAGAARGEIVEPGEYVVIALTDSGRGMDLDLQRQIFEPFFTTKPPGHGSGLGLSTCYGIIKQARGYIWVYSEVDRGSTFKIYLPRTDESFEADDQDALRKQLSGDETVLVVEDDEQVRALTVRALTAHGYRTLAAESGADALRVLDESADDIHMLLTDVIMPSMSGRELAEAALSVAPHLRVLFMSGYTEHHIVTHGVLHPGVRLLQKPFTPERLVQAVRETLDQSRSTTELL